MDEGTTIMTTHTTVAQLRDAIRHAEAAADGDSNDREIAAWQEVGGLASRLADLVAGDDRTWNVTVTGSEEDDGEAPYVYVVSAQGEGDAKRQALVAWCAEMQDSEADDNPRKVEAERGMPQFGAYNDLRPIAGD